MTRLGRSGVATAKTWSMASRTADDEVAQALVGVDHDPGPPGPEHVEDAGDVAGGVTESASAGRRGAARTLNPSGWASRYSSRISLEVVTLRLGGEGVEDRDARVGGAGRWRPRRTAGRGRTSTTGSVRVAGQELGGIGGQERLAAAARGRRDHDDPAPARRAPGPSAIIPRRPRVMRDRPDQRPAQLVVVGVERHEVVGPDLDDLGQIGAGPLVEGQDDGEPRVPLVERGEAAESGPVHEGRSGDEDVPVGAGEVRVGPAGVGTGLDDAARGDDVVAEPGCQLTRSGRGREPGAAGPLWRRGQLS